MINSTLCPLCKDGVGHAMDEEHAEKVRALLASCELARGNLQTMADASSYYKEKFGAMLEVINEALIARADSL